MKKEIKNVEKTYLFLPITIAAALLLTTAQAFASYGGISESGGGSAGGNGLRNGYTQTASAYYFTRVTRPMARPTAKTTTKKRG